MSIFNSDDSKRGYTDGISDAEAGKDKNLLGMMSPKSIIWGDAAMDSYAKAYDQGYIHGQAKMNNVFSSQTQNHATNVTINIEPDFTIADASAISDFSDELSQFGKQLSSITADMTNFLFSLQNGNWDDPNLSEFMQLFSRASHRIEGVENNIQRSMIPLLQSYAEAVRKAQMGGGK